MLCVFVLECGHKGKVNPIVQQVHQHGVRKLADHNLEYAEQLTALIEEVGVHVEESFHQGVFQFSFEDSLEVIEVVNGNPLDHQDEVGPEGAVLFDPDNEYLHDVGNVVSDQGVVQMAVPDGMHNGDHTVLRIRSEIPELQCGQPIEEFPDGVCWEVLGAQLQILQG